MTTPETITSEIQKLSPSAIIELYQLDTTNIGGEVFYFHAGTNDIRTRITWQGQAYEPFPVKVSGFEYNGNGQLPRPKLVVANVTGVISTLVLLYQDLLGAKVTRKRTFAKYLDAVNFDGGVNPTADDTAEFADDVFFIDRKSNENKSTVEFELAAAFDVTGVKLPRRQIVQNVCPWKYRGSECGYTGTQYFNAKDEAVGSAALDVCGKRLSSCKVRFGQYVSLAAPGAPPNDTLGAGLTITAPNGLTSRNGRYQMVMQNDGNLVVYNKAGRAIWNTETQGNGDGCYLSLQYDGNLVVYNAANVALWSSNTAGSSVEFLRMQDDGNLVLYSYAVPRVAVWSIGYSFPDEVIADSPVLPFGGFPAAGLIR